MPDNNRKILPDEVIARLKTLYSFTYDKDANVIVTSLSTCKRVTKHPADKPFIIISKWLGKKVSFNMDAINIWKSFQSNSRLSKYSLFEVQNAINKLRIMYQHPNEYNVAELLKTDFNGIRKI